MSLVKHFPEWEKVRSGYNKIEIPVLLIYGDHDWTTSAERENNFRTFPGAKIEIVHDAGHFLQFGSPGGACSLDYGILQ